MITDFDYAISGREPTNSAQDGISLCNYSIKYSIFNCIILGDFFAIVTQLYDKDTNPTETYLCIHIFWMI